MSKAIVLSSAEQVSMADEWFDIATTNHFWMEWRFRMIARCLGLIEGAHLANDQKFLEIGCGHGQFMKQAERLNIVVDGCDLNMFALNKIEGVSGKTYVYNINDRQPEMMRKYDGVFLLDVIEHIDDDSAFLSAALDHVSPSGFIVINVPALSSLFSKYDTAAGHKRRYSKESLRAVLLRSGIQPVIVRYWGFSLLLVAIVRKFYLQFIPPDKIIEKGFKPGNSFINRFFGWLMKVELLLLNDPIYGTSIVAIGRKIKPE